MTIQIQAVESLRAFIESTFGADLSASLGSFTYIPMNEASGSLTLTTDEVDPLYVVQSRYEGREKVTGKRSASLKFAVDLAPTGVAAASGVAAVSGPVGMLLKATMGGEHLGTGTTFAAGCTAIVLNVTSAAGLLAGDFIGWANSLGIVEWRQIKLIAANVVTLSHGFSGTPSNTNVCYACANYYFTEDPATSVQFLVSGQESDDRWLLVGGQCEGGIALNIDPSGAAIPTIEFTFSFAHYYMSGETASAITGTLADATYTYYSPIVGHVGEFRMHTVGSPTLVTSSRIHVSALGFEPKIVFQKITSPSGVGTIYRWRGGRANPPVSGNFVTFYEDLTWFTARDTKADRCMQHTFGTTGGAAVILSAPTVQVLNPQRTPSDEQIAGQTVTWEGRRNTDTAQTTELARSPCIIALG